MFGNKITYIEVDYRDVEKKIKEVYGQEFCFVTDQETSNGDNVAFNDIGDDEIYPYEKAEIEVFKLKGQDATDASARDLLNHMAENGHIEKGNYLVNVFW